MTNLMKALRASLGAALALSIVCCGLYPALVTAAAQAAFRRQANGSLIRDDRGRVRGSVLLGQAFSGARYFHPRPSAAGAGYDATASGGSSLGPATRALRDAVQARAVAFREGNGLASTQAVPADAVTASGSGLDPHISPAAARLQAARVAAARNLQPSLVAALVERAVEKPQCGIFGEPRVNVLRLNRALDKAEGTGP